MPLIQRDFVKRKQQWVAWVDAGPVTVGCSGDKAPNPIEKARLEWSARPKTAEGAIELFKEMIRRREAEGYVETERSRSLRSFERTGPGPTIYWSIQIHFLWPTSLDIQIGPADEIGKSGQRVHKRRKQVREFKDREALRRWYGAEVARRLAEGFVEILPRSNDFSELGSDSSILPEVVDAGELTDDSYAEPGSPTAQWMESKRRPCLVPVTVDGDGPDIASKFAGLPWLAQVEDWPECPTCRVPMQFLVQVNLDALPEEIGPGFGKGLLQFFACLRDQCSDELCESYPKNQLRRIVKPKGPGRASIPDGVEAFPPKLITGWTIRDDYPASEERGWLDGNIVTDDGLTEQYPALAGDKLGGWPYWIQGVEYPECDRCGKRMRLLFQVDSGVNIPHAWGDNGCAHLTQCPRHKALIAFDWACG